MYQNPKLDSSAKAEWIMKMRYTMESYDSQLSDAFKSAQNEKEMGKKECSYPKSHF